MTPEEKAERYNEALERAKKLYEQGTITESLNYVFPELAESEDERIRKEMIFYFQEEIPQCSIQEHADKMKEFIAWLEKQGKNNMGISEATKQKLENNLNKALEKETPESWNEFLEKQGEQKPIYSEEQHEKESLSEIENRIINFAMQFHDNRMKPEAEWEDEVKMLRDNIPSFSKIDTWSEEDEVKINRIVACLENLNVADNDILLKDVDWLKSIKDRYTWKPSEEQIEALVWCKSLFTDPKLKSILESLINELKKLKG